MQSFLLNGWYYRFPGDRESLIHLFYTGDSSKDSQYKDTDSQLEASEVTLENPVGPQLQKGTRNEDSAHHVYWGWDSLDHIHI